MCHRRAARRGRGGRLTTLNVRPWAVTTLNLGHVSNFLSSNISRKQTRQYRKSTKEATSGKRCERKGETNNCSKKTAGLIMQAVIGAHCNNFTGSRAYVASFIRCGSDSLDMTSQATLSRGFKSVSLCK